ncbi:putative T7SS-secreted protein [Streptomyces sp. NPDC003860]
MNIGDFVPDVIEDKVEDGVEAVGNAVEEVGDWTADRLDDVGWESGADWVRDKSRSMANRMGAEVDELDLGQTEDKTKLVYGSPSKIRSTAKNLKDFQEAFDGVGRGIAGLDSSALKGEAADAFRAKVKQEPPRWYKAADAFEKAAGALDAFAGTVEWAQGRAQSAIEKWKEGVKASQDAADAHKAKVDAYNEAADEYNAKPADRRDPSSLPPKPGAFSDPGKAKMEEAQSILVEARKQRNTAAETARSAVRAARDAAPPKPSYGEQFKDGLEELPQIQMRVLGGAVKGTAGIVSFVRSVNPLDSYNLTHPADYLLQMNNLGAGLVLAANDPIGTGKQIVTTFMKDPAEGFGRLAPDVLLTVATGGGGAAVKGVRVAKEGADAALDANRARRAFDGEGGPDGKGGKDGSGKDPDGPNQDKDDDKTDDETDPIDLATGRMYLPQTDVVLPGELPLEFTRRVESGYRYGRFFGPSWSSTVDERLEVDAEGVVHVLADGRLRTYPHPVPGVPTLPTVGTELTELARTGSGDYVLTDPVSGLVRHFAAPADAVEPGADGDAWLVQVSDRNGNAVLVDRADDGTPLGLAHSGGYRLALTVADGRVTALDLTDASGSSQRIRTYGYEDGNLTAVTKPSGAVLAFGYDERRRVTSWTDSNGRRYDYAYDDRDRCVAEGGEAGHVALTLAYGERDPRTGHRTTTLTTADGAVTRHLIGRGNKILATTDPLGNTTRHTYDVRGNRLTTTDPLGRTTAYIYDGQGRLEVGIRPDGTEVRFVRDDAGLPVEVVRPDGTRLRGEYDERGNRTAVTDGAGHTTRYGYDDRGRLTSVTDPAGAVTAVRCDAAGLPVEVRDPLGGTTRYERDAFGRPVRVVDPLGGVESFAWTVDGLLARRTAPDGASESWTYDGEGNCTSHTDALGAVSRFEYTHFDLLAARTDPDGTRYAFEHDASLRLTRVTNPAGLTWTYTYDEAGRLASETDFDGRTLTYARDAAGQVVSRTNALDQTVAYEHDRLGRVVRKDAAGAVTTYAYDRAGRLAQAAGPDAELVHQYDRRGLLKTELVDGRVTTYAYDALGRRTRRVTPTGRRTTYDYDAAGRRTRLTSGGHRIDFAHDESGREVERSVGDVLRITSTWDAAGRLSTQHLTGRAGAINHRAYTYRADGHLTALDDGLRGPMRFDLDGAGRVTSVTARNWTESYAYDSAGNQTDASWPDRHPGHEATGPRAYSGTTITRAGAVRYEHDALGRITLRQKPRLSRKPDTWRYAWDAEDRLVGVVTPDGARWRYRYDPLGRRIAKQRLSPDGATVLEETRFTWDASTLCEQVTHSPDLPHPVALTWDHQGLRPLSQSERILDASTASQQDIDERFFAIATDLVGTPTELVDESGSVAWRTRTTLWGTTTWTRTSTAYTPLRFPGQYFDPETGLHYNYFRHYDPETARYLTPDPLGLAPAPNPATYVHNPLTWMDPLGLAPYENNGGLGELVKVNKPDPAADALAERLGGESRVKFQNDPTGREFDAISDDYVAQSKPGDMQMGSALRNQAKATFEAAITSGRTPYFHFEGEPRPGVVNKLQEYGHRYGVEPVIDISPLE